MSNVQCTRVWNDFNEDMLLRVMTPTNLQGHIASFSNRRMQKIPFQISPEC